MYGHLSLQTAIDWNCFEETKKYCTAVSKCLSDRRKLVASAIKQAF